jgi:hypothetical protein
MNFLVPYTVYPFDVMFSFGQTDKELVVDLKNNSVNTRDKSYKYEQGEAAKYVHYTDGFTLIRLKEIPKSPEDYGHLQHEIFHAVTCLMAYVGASLNDGSNESFAYVIGYLTERVYTKIMNIEK